MAVVGAVVTSLVVIGAASLLSMLGTGESTTVRPTPLARVSVPNERHSTAMGWLQGLADGLIWKGDVTDRLRLQEPAVARTVSDVWSELKPYRDSPRLRSTLIWVRGLADGLLSVTDVSDRLMGQDAQMSRTVLATWHRLTLNDRAMRYT